jgi:hypothetical protein
MSYIHFYVSVSSFTYPSAPTPLSSTDVTITATGFADTTPIQEVVHLDLGMTGMLIYD